MISLATSDINLKTWINVGDCLLSKRLGRGKYVDRFEKMAAEYFGSKHAIAVSNGTMADLLMLLTLKEIYPNKNEVILPALTFVAQANAVVMAGLKPVFVDVTEDFNMDWSKVNESLEKTLCIFPVHLLGKYSGMRKFFYSPIIEDCCEAMGGALGVKRFGTFGLAGAFSMFPSHTITTGEGGFVITNNEEFNEITRSIMNHGKYRSNDFDFKYFGINAKMTNLQAAVGCSLIEGIDKVNHKRMRHVDYYNFLLDNDFYSDAPHCYPIILGTREDRDAVLLALKNNGIEARKLMGCIPEYEFYKKKFPNNGIFPVASRLANCGLFVPIHQNLKKEEIDKICSVIRSVKHPCDSIIKKYL